MYQRYAQDTPGTKPILSRAAKGFHFPDTGKNGEMAPIFRLVCHTGNPVITGDFNIHVDVLGDVDRARLLELW